MIMAFLSTPSLNSFPPSPIGVSATWRGNHLGPPHPQEKEAHGVDIGPSVKRLLEKEDPSLPSSGFAIPTLFKKCLLPSSPGRSSEHLESTHERESVLKHTNLLLPSCHSLFSAGVLKGYKRLRAACSDEKKSRHDDLFLEIFSLWKNGGERSRKRSVGDIN